MNMKTVFEGIINGEKFNTVQAYNARMIELMNSGTPIQASSSTKSVADNQPKDVNFTHHTVDEDLSYFPYFDENDPFYLDLLVTNDPNVNIEARTEMNNILNKCYTYIVNSLNDNTVTSDDKKEYLSDIRKIIKSLESDRNENKAATNNIKTKRDNAAAQLHEAQTVYDAIMHTCATEEQILNGADLIINDFLTFYQNVEAEGIRAMAENKCSCGNPHNNCICSTKFEQPDILTAIKENYPQFTTDLCKLFNQIFESNQGGRNLK